VHQNFTVYGNHPSRGKNPWRFRLVHIIFMTTNFVIKPPRVEHCREPTLICSYDCVFSPLALLSCGKIIPFFLTDPQTKLGQRGTKYSTSTIGVDLAHYDPIALTLTDVNELVVGGNHPGYQCPQSRGENDHNDDHPSQSARSSAKTNRK
jgi:hypothetical protein